MFRAAHRSPLAVSGSGQGRAVKEFFSANPERQAGVGTLLAAPVEIDSRSRKISENLRDCRFAGF
jgi:hypothetical protein